MYQLVQLERVTRLRCRQKEQQEFADSSVIPGEWSGTPSGSFATYCDAQGCYKWDDTTPIGDCGGGQYQACPEFDFFEANSWGLNTTSHGCKGHNSAGFSNCNRDGNAISAIYPDNDSIVQFKPDNHAVGQCQGKTGKTQYYGPMSSCHIDSRKNFDVTVTLNNNSFTSTISQGSNKISGTQSLEQDWRSGEFDLSWTLIGSAWISYSGTGWLDGVNPYGSSSKYHIAKDRAQFSADENENVTWGLTSLNVQQ